MIKNRIDVITLGCSKNLVDSEFLMRQFREAGYDVHHDAPEVKGEIVVVNTCGFIGDAKEESVNMILSCVQAKARRKIRKLYVMGCSFSALYDRVDGRDTRGRQVLRKIRLYLFVG